MDGNAKITVDLRKGNRLTVALEYLNIFVFLFLYIFYFVFVIAASFDTAAKRIVCYAVLAFLTAIGLHYLYLCKEDRKYTIRSIYLDKDDTLHVCCDDKERIMPFEDIIMSFSYYTMRHASLILISENDYVVASISSGYMMAGGFQDVSSAFYDLVRFYKTNSPAHKEYIRSSKNRELPWIRIPGEMFELNKYSRSADLFVEKMRKKLKEES